MRPFDTALVRRVIEGALYDFSRDHPEHAIAERHWLSISKRAARVLFREHQKRFGSAPDRLASVAAERRLRECAEGE